MSVNASFFLSTTTDKCVYNGASIDAANNTQNGNLCAYVSGVNRVWACPAPDKICWTWAESCNGGDDTTPDDSQRYCGSNSAAWCCSKEYDTCTETQGQINICWGQWQNPNVNLTAGEAILYDQENYSTLASTTTSSITSSTAAASTTQSSPANTAATTTTTSSVATASTTAGASSGSSLSSGAVAGVAVGCVVGGIAIAAAAGFLFWRRRKTSATPRWAQGTESKQSTAPYELHSESLRAEADGSPAFVQHGNVVVKEGTHELPGNRFA